VSAAVLRAIYRARVYDRPARPNFCYQDLVENQRMSLLRDCETKEKENRSESTSRRKEYIHDEKCSLEI